MRRHVSVGIGIALLLITMNLALSEEKKQFVPDSELGKLEVGCDVEAYTKNLSCSVYNGSDWKLYGGRFLVVVTNKKTGEEYLRREYDAVANWGVGIRPRSTGTMTTSSLGFSVGKRERLEVGLIRAWGEKESE